MLLIPVSCNVLVHKCFHNPYVKCYPLLTPFCIFRSLTAKGMREWSVGSPSGVSGCCLETGRAVGAYESSMSGRVIGNNVADTCNLFDSFGRKKKNSKNDIAEMSQSVCI